MSESARNTSLKALGGGEASIGGSQYCYNGIPYGYQGMNQSCAHQHWIEKKGQAKECYIQFTHVKLKP